ncbi:MAG: hypothetical protein ACRD0N_07940 [Acidimicrobiales bacterium]
MNPRRTPLRLLAASLVLIGLALALLGFPARGARVEESAFAFLSTDRPGITAHNSPAVAADPSRPQSMAMADKIDTPNIDCTVSTSSNGGSTWTEVDLPLPDPATQCFWPDVAFDDGGDLLVLYTDLRERFNQSKGVWLQRFSGGSPAGEPTKVAGDHSFHARLAVDANRVFVAWVQAGSDTPFQPLGIAPGASPLMLAASADGGRTFAAPVTVSAPGQLVLQPTVLVTNDDVVVGALDLGDDLLDYESRHEGQAGEPYEGAWHVVAWTSSDRGRTFDRAATVADVEPPQRIYVDITAPTPGFGLDRASGRIYATWDSGIGDARDVYLSHSDDGGRTWAAASRLPRESSQTLPTVAVAPGGRVDLLFYDRSRDPTDVMTVPMMASSWDRGRSFTARAISDRPFDSRIGFGSLQGLPSLGQQLGLISEADRALAFWSDTRKGSVDTNAQELALALVDVEEGKGRRWPLVALAVVLVVAGVAVAVRAQPLGARPNSR